MGTAACEATGETTGLVEVEEDEVGEQVEEDQPDLEEEEAVMGVVAEHDLVVADVLGGGLGLLLCARYIVLLDEEEDEVAAEVAQKPHRRARMKWKGETDISFLVFAVM